MKLKILLHPLIVYILVWSVTALLISLNITVNLENFTGNAALLVFITISTALLFLFFENFALKKRNLYPQEINIMKLHVFANNLFLLWILLLLLYSIIVGGFGLLWIFQGVPVDYNDVQIPSLWGLNITLCYALGTIYTYLSLKSKKQSSLIFKFKFAFILLFPILIFSRNVMLQLFLQLLCITLLNSELKFKKSLFKIIGIVLIVVLIFGVVGDLRTVGGTPNPFESYIRPEYQNIMNALPSGFTWIYVYITANFNNIIYSIDNINPSFEFYPIFMNIVPGALKESVFGSSITTNSVVSSIVKDSNLTVASFYAGYVISFGLVGAVVGGIFIQLFSLFWYRLALTKNFGYQLCFCAIFACMVFSIFYDAFFTMGTLAQLILGVFIAKKCKLKTQ